MIRSELNFPCVEATRGFLTCKERNLRLSCSPKGEVFLSKHRRDWEEWYISIQEQHGLSIMRLQSVKHGYFLKAHTPGDDTGSTSPLVGTSELDSKDCRWLMEPSLLDTYPTCNDDNDDRPNQSKNNRFVLAGQFQQDVRLTTSTIRDTPTSKSSSPKKTPRSSVGRGFQFPFLVKQDPKAERQREEDDLQEEVSFEDEPPIPIPEDMRIRRSQSFDPSEDSSSSSIQGENEIDPEEGEGEDLSWEIEYSSGELCYISNPVIDRRIRCNVIGTLTLNEAWLGWELFRFIESNDEDGTLVISSWTHSDQFLSSDPDGNVFCTSNRLGYFEKWQVVRGDTAVRLQSVAHQRYLTVDGEGSKAKLRTTTSISEPRAQWHLEAAHRNTYSISSLKHGSSVSCAKEAPTVSKHPKAYGEWKIERAIDYDEGTFTLYNDKMKAYLGSTNAGKCTLTNKIGYWAIWEIEESVSIISSSPSRLCIVSRSGFWSYLCFDSHMHRVVFCFHPISTSASSHAMKMENCVPPMNMNPKKPGCLSQSFLSV